MLPRPRNHGPRRAGWVAAALLLASACGDSPAPSAAVAGAPQSPPAPERRDPGPRIAFDGADFDFGRVSDVEPLRHVFAFRNEGDQRLVVTEVKASCGCTATSLSKTTYEPGESGAIEIEWEPLGFGSQKKTVTVATNGRPERTILSVAAEIEPFVSLDPIHLDFGQRQLGREHELRAELRCADPELEVLAVSSSNAYVRAELVQGEEGKREVVVTILPSAPWGTITGQANLLVRGRPDPEAEPVEHRGRLGYHGQLFGELLLDKTLFPVGRVDPGGSFRTEIELKRVTGEAFRIEEARLLDAVPDTMQLEVEELSGARYRLVVHGEVGSYVGKVSAHVLLRTDVPGEEERRIAVMGLVRALEPHEH